MGRCQAMVPESRVQDGSFPIPKLLIGKEDISQFIEEFRGIGKVENCQVGVFAAYASRHGYCFLENRLFVPEKWFGEEYAKRREKCKLPKEISFRTKPQLGAEMFEEIVREKVIPFRYVVADTVYGSSPEFIDAVEKTAGVTYLVSLPLDTLCWIHAPAILEKTYRYRG